MNRPLYQKKQTEMLTAYLFVSPAILLISIFGLVPVFYALWVSLNKWRISRRGFIGLSNYEQIFGDYTNLVLVFIAGLCLCLAGIIRSKFSKKPSQIIRILVISAAIILFILALPRIASSGDERMLQSLQVTIFYALGSVPIQIIGGLSLAIALNQKIYGKQFFRMVFLLPYIVPTVAAASVFEVLFSLRPESFANQIIKQLGFSELQWLGEPRGIFEMLFRFGSVSNEVSSNIISYWLQWASGPSLALVSIMFFNYWVFIGYYALIYTNGLAQIDRQLFEAASIDGAKPWTVIRKILIPLLSPTTFFLTMIGIMGTFKAFNHIYILRNLSTRGATDPMSVYIFFTFVRRQRLDQASTIAIVLFLLVLGITIYHRQNREKRIEYGQ